VIALKACRGRVDTYGVTNALNRSLIATAVAALVVCLGAGAADAASAPAGGVVLAKLCPMFYKGVTGTDGKEYANECLFPAGVTLAHDGPPTAQDDQIRAS
jgi:hypothetical protein